MHLLAAGVLFAYVYLPLGSELEELVRFAIFPILALTGSRCGRRRDSPRPEVAPRGTRGQGANDPTEGGIEMQLREINERVTYGQQLQEDTPPIVLINQFTVAPEDADRLLHAWAEDAAYMKQQPLHLDPASSRHRRQRHVRQRGQLEPARALGQAFSSREFSTRPRALSGEHRRRAARLREGRCSRNLRELTGDNATRRKRVGQAEARKDVGCHEPDHLLDPRPVQGEHLQRLPPRSGPSRVPPVRSVRRYKGQVSGGTLTFEGPAPFQYGLDHEGRSS